MESYLNENFGGVQAKNSTDELLRSIYNISWEKWNLDPIDTLRNNLDPKGNAAFSSGNFNEAIKFFTQAIDLSPTNHVLYSNRSASYASLNKYSEALEDAKKTVELKPDWPKGYSRLGAAYQGLSKFDEAIESYKKGLEVDPNNEALKSGLADAQDLGSRSAKSPFGSIYLK